MFKVGQKVWCLCHGKGVVVDIAEPMVHHAIRADFDNSTEWYTTDGRLFSDGNRTLFFSEPKIEALESPPFVPTLIGKTILLRSNTGGKDYVVEVLEETESLLYTTGGKFIKNCYTMFKIGDQIKL